MPMQQQSDQSTLAIPQELRKKHGPLIDLILGSESMNDEERQYWINILPVMTEAQIGNLQQILQNEHDQLAAIDAKYSGETKQRGIVSTNEMEQKIRKRKAVRTGSESASEEEEKQKEEEILRKIEEGGEREDPARAAK